MFYHRYEDAHGKAKMAHKKKRAVYSGADIKLASRWKRSRLESRAPVGRSSRCRYKQNHILATTFPPFLQHARIGH